MNERFQGFTPRPSDSEKEPLRPLAESITPSHAKMQSIKSHVATLPEGTYLWNDLKRAEMRKSVSQFTVVEAAHLIERSGPKEWEDNPAFYAAVVELIEEFEEDGTQG